jgi:hypothetical protein
MRSVEIIVFCEDFFGRTAQLIHGRPIIAYGNWTNFVLSNPFVPSALSASSAVFFSPILVSVRVFSGPKEPEV